MSQFYFEYTPDWYTEPMSYWVHISPLAGRIGVNDYLVPPPDRVKGKGYPVLCVEVGDFTFRFSSPEQLQVCIDVLGSRLLPNIRRLVAIGGGRVGPNSHWLSRLPARVKATTFRQKAVSVLREAQVWAESLRFGHVV